MAKSKFRPLHDRVVRQRHHQVGADHQAALDLAVRHQALHDALTAKGITHTFRLTEGRHEWVVWRHHLHEVAPLLFR